MHSINAILILYNYTAYQIDMLLLPINLIIIFLPPNVTSPHQAVDMGIISSLKIGYKILLLERLLEIFNVDGGYDFAAEQRAK